MDIDYLKDFIDEKTDGNVSGFEQSVGLTHASLRPLLIGERKSINMDRVVLIKEKYPDFSIEKFAGLPVRSKSSVPIKDRSGIPYIPVRAQAGYITNFGDDTYIDELPKFTIPGLNENDNYRMFQVQGASMYPTLDEDDIVVCSKCERPEELVDNYVYVVVTFDKGVLIKRVRNRIADKKALILISDNFAGGNTPKLVPISQIQEMWKVRRRITANLSYNKKLTNRMDDMEVRMMEIQNMIDNYFKGEI